MKTNPPEKYPPLTNVLHIYAQPFWHSPAYIVGDYIALRNLAEIILATIEKNNYGDVSGMKLEAFVNDGEGYNIIVRQRTPAEMQGMAVPYADECASEKNDGATWPGRMK